MTQAPEFSRPIPVTELAAGLTVSEAATPDECAALAVRFGLPAVRSLSMTGTVSAWGQGGWRLDGVVCGAFTQTCVLTLDPVDTEIREPFTRFAAPASRLSAMVAMHGEDEAEPLGDALDVGEAAAEAAALAIDPYPRRPGVQFDGALHGPPDAAPLTDEAIRPFAALAALKQGRRRGD